MHLTSKILSANLDYFTQQNDSSQWKQGKKAPPKNKNKQTHKTFHDTDSLKKFMPTKTTPKITLEAIFPTKERNKYSQETLERE